MPEWIESLGEANVRALSVVLMTEAQVAYLTPAVASGMVLEVDPIKRRISLGLKQCLANPWESFAEQHPPGSVIEGEVKNITEFGLFKIGRAHV